MKESIREVLSKPFSRISYENSSHCESITEYFPSLQNDIYCNVNEYGIKRNQKNEKYSFFEKIQSLNVILLKNVFFYNYILFDEKGNIYPDSFRLGPRRKIALNNIVELSINHFTLKSTMRQNALVYDIETIDSAFLFDIAMQPYLGHFLAETATRLWFDYPDKAKFLSSCNFPNYLFFYLNKFNISRENFITTNRVVFIKQLYIANQSSYLGSTFYPIAKEIYLKFTSQSNDMEKLYLSRSRFERRMLINEKKIEDILCKYGFKIINPELLPIDEQVRLCSKAKAIVGCVGTQMLHRLGLQDCNVLYLSPKGFPSINTFMNIEKAYNNFFDVIYGDYIKHGKAYSDPWCCDIENFETGLVQWIEKNNI